ncbi:hypothetical protein V8E51_004981 [Hyaloscypha variabilis]
MTTIILTSTATAPVATSSIEPTQMTLLTTAASSVVTTTASAGLDYYCPKSHSLAEAAGVGIAVGALVAAIVIMAFALIRRRQTRARKMSPTIAPDVLVTGPMVDNQGGWEDHREESKNLGSAGGNPKISEPPTYAKRV